MNDWKTEVSKVIYGLEDEKNKIIKQQEFLTSINFEKFAPNEKQWHELMEIDEIRCNKILCSCLIKNIFPESTDIKLYSNSIHFKLNNIECMVSTSRLLEVGIVGKYKKEYNEFKSLTKDQCLDLIATVFDLRMFCGHSIDFYNTERRKDTPNIIKQKDYFDKVDGLLRQVDNEYDIICSRIDDICSQIGESAVSSKIDEEKDDDRWEDEERD
jgi:hypothetical protein